MPFTSRTLRKLQFLNGIQRRLFIAKIIEIGPQVWKVGIEVNLSLLIHYECETFKLTLP